MIGFNLVGWAFAFISLAGAAIFFWREMKIAGFTFTIVFIVVLAGVSEKRVVLTSAMLGITLERDAEHSLQNERHRQHEEEENPDLPLQPDNARKRDSENRIH